MKHRHSFNPFDRSTVLRGAAVVLVAMLLASIGGATENWPQHRRDAARSGFTPEALPARLNLGWTYIPRHQPVRAWPRSARLDFDDAFRVVIADGVLCFGSSADGKITALDAATGRERWSFVTEAPVRFAPVLWRDQVIAGSDDGFVYCLSRADGRLIWRRRAGPRADRVLGNGRLISRWPVRGAPVVKGDVLFVAAGVWPSEGIYLYAIDLESGEELWRNDKSGSIYMAQPHPGAFAESGVAAQGCLAANDTQIFVPTGRAVPAAFERASGKFQYFRLSEYGRMGGTKVMTNGPGVLNMGAPFDAATGKAVPGFKLGAVVGLPEGVARYHRGTLELYDWVRRQRKDRKGKPFEGWVLEKHANVGGTTGEESEARAFIVAEKLAVVGHDGVVRGIDLTNGVERWRLAIDGSARDLAVAGGSLFVSTDRGQIHCFSATGGPSTRLEPKKPVVATGRVFQDAAAEVLRRSGTTRGFCVDLGCGDGSLALELARSTDLKIYAVEDDASVVEKVRRRLDAAGVLGVRVTVVEAALDAETLPPRIANLVVSGRTVLGKPSDVSQSAVDRLLRPYGGVSCFGPPGAMSQKTRGALAGAGSWTHQYASPANTSCSQDQLVRGRLKMLWFRDVGQEVPQRHGRGPAPLFREGRLFSEGLDSIVAVDAYNGDLLWEFPIPGALRAFDGDHLMGTAGAGSNYCVAEEGVFVAQGNTCIRIDARTGKELGRFTPPPGASRHVEGEPEGAADDRPPRWGMVLCTEGILFGTAADTQHTVTFRFKAGGDMTKQLTESSHLFAFDPGSGDCLWTYAAKESLRHNAVAIGMSRVFLIDRAQATVDRRGAKRTEHKPGSLVALDAKTGKEVWREDEGIDGTLLAFSSKDDALLMSYQVTNFRLESERGRRLTVYQASTGKKLWENSEANYRTRPLIINSTVYAQGGAWDIRSGEKRPFKFERSYGCGQMSGSASMLLYRSATLGYFNLDDPAAKNRDFGGLRPGCWINAIPAGGMVLMPDASAGCVCSYLNQSWVALEPTAD